MVHFDNNNFFGGFLLFYILAISKVTSGWAQTCDSAHSWLFYSAAPLGNQATSTMS